MRPQESNWAGNIKYSAKKWHSPQSIEELAGIVQQAEKVKVVGSRHSFNHIADTSYDAISLQDWNQIISLDSERQIVTIEGGMRYGELATYLQSEGFALHNLASLPHISVVGAIMTATHGSGLNNANLATPVVELEFMKADGELIRISREENSRMFPAAVVSLGALGIITKISLSIEASYDMRQVLYQDLPLAQLDSHFDEIMASAYSVSLFTDWQGETINQVWLKQRMSELSKTNIAGTFYGAKAAEQDLHPIPGISAENCTQQMGIVGAWHERLPHFRMNFTPSSGEELQSEYFVPRKNGLEALKSLLEISEQIAPLILTSEIRGIAADDFWMSPCFQQDCIAFHFTWKQDVEKVQKLLPLIEDCLKHFDVRPHWGKLFTLKHDYLQSQYENWDNFKQMMNKLDPQGKFRNPFLDELFRT